MYTGAIVISVILVLGYLPSNFLFGLAKEIPRDYRHFGISLGVKSSTIDAIEHDFSKNVADITFKVIETWNYGNKNKSLNEMYSELKRALSKLDRNDLVNLVINGE